MQPASASGARLGHDGVAVEIMNGGGIHLADTLVHDLDYAVTRPEAVIIEDNDAADA
jgi:hypothetical protein